MSARRQFIISEHPVIHFLPVFRTKTYFAEIRDQISHWLMVAANISRNLQMNATGQLNWLFRAVHRITLYEYRSKFRVGNPEDEFSCELFFLRNAFNGIFHISFAFTVSDGLLWRTKQFFIPAIGIRPMNPFNPETRRQNCCPFNWLAVFVLNYNQHFFEFNCCRNF